MKKEKDTDTRIDYDSISDREIDALVAEKVLKLPIVEGPNPYQNWLKRDNKKYFWIKGKHDGCEYDWAKIPNYSTDIAAAWEVVEKMNQKGWRFMCESLNTLTWEVDFIKGKCGEVPKTCTSQALTAPRAICLAALKAVGDRDG